MSLHFSPKVRDHLGGVSFFGLWLWPPSRTDRGVPSALGLRAQYPALPEIRGALDRPRAMKMDERSRTPDRVHRNEAQKRKSSSQEPSAPAVGIPSAVHVFFKTRLRVPSQLYGCAKGKVQLIVWHHCTCCPGPVRASQTCFFLKLPPLSTLPPSTQEVHQVSPSKLWIILLFNAFHTSHHVAQAVASGKNTLI